VGSSSARALILDPARRAPPAGPPARRGRPSIELDQQLPSFASAPDSNRSALTLPGTSLVTFDPGSRHEAANRAEVGPPMSLRATRSSPPRPVAAAWRAGHPCWILMVFPAEHGAETTSSRTTTKQQAFGHGTVRSVPETRHQTRHSLVDAAPLALEGCSTGGTTGASSTARRDGGSEVRESSVRTTAPTAEPPGLSADQLSARVEVLAELKSRPRG